MRGDKRLHEHLRSQDGISAAADEQLYDKLYTPPDPEIFAEILSYSLALIELHVISTIEDRMKARGTTVDPNSLLVNKSNPLNLEINGKTGNILETLYSIPEDEFLDENYLDISSDGTFILPPSSTAISKLQFLSANSRTVEGSGIH